LQGARRQETGGFPVTDKKISPEIHPGCATAAVRLAKIGQYTPFPEQSQHAATGNSR